MLENIAGENPSLAVSDSSDRSCAFVIVEESDFSKANHLVAPIAFHLEHLLQCDLLLQVFVVRIRPWMVDSDADLTLRQDKVF